MNKKSYDVKTVEKKLKEFSRIRKQLEIFENILSEYKTLNGLEWPRMASNDL